MSEHNSTSESEQATDHAAEDLETIIVNPDDVLEMMLRNERDKDQQRAHVLRVTPPLKGVQKASLHVVQEGNHYPPETSPRPIHISATLLFEGRIDAQLDSEIRAPEYGVERARFNDEYGVGPDDVDEEADVDVEDLDDEWDEWWDTTVEVWESEVRKEMREPTEIQLGGYFEEEPETTVEVRFQEEDL